MDWYTIISLVGGTVLSLVLAYLRRKSWVSTAISEAIEAGVRTAWDTYGKDLKAEKQEGKTGFTLPEKEKLHEVARSTASSVLASQGLDLNKLVASQQLQDLKIKQTVERLKQASSKS